MSKKISVIVPAYNCEKYIKDCVLSILNQTYNNLELLVIDDGSTDDTGAILDRLTEDSRLIVYHRTNHGVQESRNYGISQATGEYIALVDADDVVAKEMYETLIKLIETDNSDFAACSYQKEYGEITKNSFSTDEIESAETLFISGKENIYDNMLSEKHSVEGFVWNKVYRASILKNVSFRKDVSIIDDSVFSWELVDFGIESASYINVPFYRYRIIKSSITRSSNIRKFFNALFGLEKMISITETKYKTNLPKLYVLYEIWILNVATQVAIQKMTKQERKDNRRRLIEKLQTCSPYIKNRNIKFSLKRFLFLHVWWLYILFAKVVK